MERCQICGNWKQEEIDNVQLIGKVCQTCVKKLFKLFVIYKTTDKEFEKNCDDYNLCDIKNIDRVVASVYVLSSTPESLDDFKKRWLSVRDINI